MYDHNCRRCALSDIPRNTANWVCVPGEGPKPADIMLVGEAPGAREEKEGRPFIGDAGRELNKLLAEVGLKRSDVYISNIVRCRPPNNRQPTADEIFACRMYFLRELEVVQPKVIVALGGSSGCALTGKKEVGANRGRTQQLLSEFRSEIPVLITYHPAAFLHNRGRAPQYKAAIGADLRLAMRIVTPSENGTQPAKTSISNNRQSIQILHELATADRLACDAEWEVLEYKGGFPWSRRGMRRPQLLSIALAGRVDGELKSVSIIAEGKFREACLRLIERIPTIFHNAGSDLLWLTDAGSQVNLAGCTLLLASMLNFDHSISLQVLASMMTDMDPQWKEATATREDWVMGQRPKNLDEWTDLLERNAHDAEATLLLEESLLRYMKERKREALLPLYQELLPAITSLTRASLCGAPIDVDALKKLESDINIRCQEYRKQLARLLDVPGFVTKKSGSATDVAYALERVGEFRLKRTPKTKRPSVKIDNLKPYENSHPAVAIMIRLLTLEKLHGTYLYPWRYLMEQQGDAHLHTAFKLWVARTGRSSAEIDRGGTIQQFPRSARIRALVRARPGYQILSADQGQIELRIGAWIANEPTLLRFFKEGICPHKATAAWIKALQRGLSLPEMMADLERWTAEITPAERQAAKPPNFGFQYGMREATFIETAKKDYGITFTMEEAITAREGYFILYAGFRKWHIAERKKGGIPYVDTPLGRRRDLIKVKGEDADSLFRKRLNTPVQATASDVSLIGSSEADEVMFNEGLMAADLVLGIGFIHDAGMWEVHESKIDYAQAVIKDCMEDPAGIRRILGHKIPVPLVVDFKISDTWS